MLTGSLIRVPLGMWTDKFGGRIVMFVLMMVCVVPIWLIGYATEYWQFLVLGLFVGVAGGSFSVGTPTSRAGSTASTRASRWASTARATRAPPSTSSSRPRCWSRFGWTLVPQVYAAVMLGTAILFWFFSYSRPAAPRRLEDHLAAAARRRCKDPNVWKYCQYYSIVFGGYVALSLWMTQYYVAEYGFDIQLAALLAACFSLPGGVLRAVGGWLSDKCGAHTVTWWVLWVSWICLFILSYPQTDMTVTTVERPEDVPRRPRTRGCSPR